MSAFSTTDIWTLLDDVICIDPPWPGVEKAALGEDIQPEELAAFAKRPSLKTGDAETDTSRMLFSRTISKSVTRNAGRSPCL